MQPPCGAVAALGLPIHLTTTPHGSWELGYALASYVRNSRLESTTAFRGRSTRSEKKRRSTTAAARLPVRPGQWHERLDLRRAPSATTSGNQNHTQRAELVTIGFLARALNADMQSEAREAGQPIRA